MLTTLRKLLFRVLLGSLFLVGFFVLSNRVFASIYARHMLGSERRVGGSAATAIGIVMLLIFVLLWPVVYIWHLKLTVLGKVVGTIWAEYRDEFVEVVVGRAVGVAYTLQQKGSTLVTSAVDVYGDLPMLIRRVVSYIKHKVPLLEQIQESIETIEREQIDSPQEAQQYVMNAIQQKMSTTLPEDTHSSVYILILCNIGLALAVVYLVH